MEEKIYGYSEDKSKKEIPTNIDENQKIVFCGISGYDLQLLTSNNPITVSTPNGTYTIVSAEEVSQALDIYTTELENKQNKVLSGTAEPDASLGANGDVYVMYE